MDDLSEWALSFKKSVFVTLSLISFMALRSCSFSLISSAILASLLLLPALLPKATVLFRLLMDKVPFVRRLFWRKWYNFITDREVTSDVAFMNYGYAQADEHLELEDTRWVANQYSVQLYHFVATSAGPLSGKRVLEVGCGRGGGTCFIAEMLKPKEMVGIDFSSENIQKAKETFGQTRNLEFQQGDAEQLPFPDESFDVIVNVESSHCYGNMEKFLQEVLRVLTPNGVFLFVDLRGASKLEELQALVHSFEEDGLVIVDEKDITPNVLRALELESPRKEAFINNQIVGVWSFLRFILREFMAIKSSEVFHAFKEGRMRYWHYVLRKEKPGAQAQEHRKEESPIDTSPSEQSSSEQSSSEQSSSEKSSSEKSSSEKQSGFLRSTEPSSN